MSVITCSAVLLSALAEVGRGRTASRHEEDLAHPDTIRDAHVTRGPYVSRFSRIHARVTHAGAAAPRKRQRHPEHAASDGSDLHCRQPWRAAASPPHTSWETR